MGTNFRSEMFKLCNKLLDDKNAKKIRDVIHKLSLCEIDGTTGVKNGLHGNFSYLARKSNTQFHGYLFLDDNADIIEFPQFLNIEHLAIDERVLIEQGHVTITSFINTCLYELNEKSPVVAEAMNPYFLLKEVKVNQGVQSLLSKKDIECSVQAFRNGKAYKLLMDSNITCVFDKFDSNKMRGLISVINNEFDKSYGDNINSDLRDFSVRLLEHKKNMEDVVFSAAVLIYALKESMRMACQMIYSSICGIDLTVLNNDNIINIEAASTNTIYRYYKVLVQGAYFNDVGNVVLLDCDISDDEHIHEFGMVIAQTTSIATEFGETTKFTLITLNEEMIQIEQMVNKIIDNGFPKGILR